jgi:hypothetical protein
MPFALYIDVVPEGGGRNSVTHIFYGETEQEARENFAAHAKGCRFLTPAIDEDRIEEELERIHDRDWPDYDEGDDEIEVEGTEVVEDDEK